MQRASRTIPHARSLQDSRGLTLIELLVTVAIVGLLAAISINVYADALKKSKVTRAIAEIRGIERAITDHEVNEELPPSA